MKTILGKHLFTLTSFLRPEECAALIERGEALGFERASVRTRTGRDMRPDIRDNDRAAFTDVQLAADLWDRCQEFLPSVDGGTPVSLDEEFRYYRYDPGQRFKPHRDGVVKREPNLRSRLTFLMYLNDGFVGGETAFYSGAVVDGIHPIAALVAPVGGTALFFAHEWLHEGRPLEAGRKYVLRTDVFYRFDD
jgi:hypothetical protein